MTTLFDVYSKQDFTKNYYLTVHYLDGRLEAKTYRSFKAAGWDILEDFPASDMMRYEVIDKKVEGSRIYLELVEHEH